MSRKVKKELREERSAVCAVFPLAQHSKWLHGLLLDLPPHLGVGSLKAVFNLRRLEALLQLSDGQLVLIEGEGAEKGAKQ
jgi:hypothetical protein